MKMKNQNGSAVIGFLIIVVIWLAAIGGWVANIVKLAGMDFASITGMIVLRAVGIVFAPLGAVLGFL